MEKKPGEPAAIALHCVASENTLVPSHSNKLSERLVTAWRRSNKTGPAMVHAAAFLLPVLALALTFAVVGVFPAGAKSSLTLDLKSQYITFFSYLRNQVFLGDGDFLYTFSKALGGDMVGFSAYYLLSPFNLLLLLFPAHLLPAGITLLTLLKVGCCGLTMSILLCEAGARPQTLLFSVPFALMDFIIAFHFNIMWLDSVALLPLVVLGIRRLWQGRGPLLYVLSLAAAIVFNYYIGYMLCLFALLYFAVLALFMEKHPAGGWRAPGGLLPVARFLGASAMAGGLSAAVLVPAVLSLAGGKAGFSAASFFDKSYASLADVASRYMPGTASAGQVFFGYPAIYCGMLALLCTVLFFRNRHIPKRARMGGGILVGVLLLSFIVGPLDRVWHGLNKPVGFLYRYSFLLSFVLLYLGWQGFTKMRGRMVARDLSFALGAALLVTLLARREAHTYVTPGKLVLGFGLAGLFAVLLWLYAKKKWRFSPLLLLLAVLADMGANMYVSLRQVDYLPMAEFSGFVQNEQPVIDAIQEKDTGFYRLEKKYSYSDNDAMLLGYNGLSHFSSADKLFVRTFLDEMGLSDGGYGVKYADGTTVAIESLLAMKYLITTGAGTVKPYELIAEKNDRLVWENPLALPVGMMAGAGVTGAVPPGDTLFDQYNALWQAIDPQFTGQLYRMLPFETVPHNVNRREFDGEQLYEKLGDDSRVEFQVTVQTDDMLYALITTKNQRNVELYINGSFDGRFLFNDRHGILPLGRFAPGQTVTVALAPAEYELFIEDVAFASEDGQALAASVQRLRAGGFQPSAHTSSRLSGVVNNTGAGREWLLLSIPYDAGWHAAVDGEAVPIQPALGALMTLPVPPGEHRVQLHYTPPGLWAGVAATVISLAALLLWCLPHRKKQDKEALC